MTVFFLCHPVLATMERITFATAALLKEMKRGSSK